MTAGRAVSCANALRDAVLDEGAVSTRLPRARAGHGAKGQK